MHFVGHLVTTLKLGILLELAANWGVNSLKEIEILLVSHYTNLVGLGLNRGARLRSIHAHVEAELGDLFFFIFEGNLLYEFKFSG